MKDKFVTEIFSIEDCDRVKSQSIKNMLVEILKVGANIKNIQTDFIFDQLDFFCEVSTQYRHQEA